MTRPLYDNLGRPLSLATSLGKGGEGAVYEVQGRPDFVAKIYHKPIDPDKALKLQIMASQSDAQLTQYAAWPVFTIHETPGARMVGFVMPRASGFVPIHHLYGPTPREEKFPKADWAFLIHAARNAAVAFHVLHSRGHVVGDVNESNVLVSANSIVRFIDCDSFQIHGRDRIWRCEVGVPTYTPPELQGKEFAAVTRTPEHDAFGLAIIIFQLIFMGRHPFAGKFAGRGDMSIEQAISQFRFSYGRWASNYQMTPPPFSLRLGHIPQQMAGMFEKAFGKDSLSGGRPKPIEWQKALEALEPRLCKCSSEPGHVYYAELRSCPWCEIMGGGGPDFFFSVSLAATFKMAVPSEADLKGILAALQQVLLPEFQKPSLPSAAEWKIAPLPLPEPVLTERKSARVLNICTFVGVLVICLGVFSWIFFAGGMAWVLILLVARAATDGGHYRAEKIRRQAYHKNARQAFLQAEEAWKTESQNGRIGIESAAAEGRQAYAGFSALDAKMNQEIQKLHSGRRESQLNHFLRTFLLADHRIEQMGPARLAILASYGVETAADINVGRIAQIPGFGEARVDTLLRWRGGCESKFRYDPAKAVPQSEVMSIQVKYAREKQRIAALMRYKLNEVQRRAATCQRNVREREAQLLRAWHAFVQADQNFKVL